MSNFNNPTQNIAKLKNGSTITVNHGSLVWVKGEVEFSRILTKYTPEEIKANNERRREYCRQNNKRCVDEDPNKVYNALTIKNAQIIPEDKNGQLNNAEIFIQDKFYTSSAQPNVLHAQFKNITQKNPQVFLREADGSMSKTPATIPGELGADVPVLIGLRIYCTQNNPGISLQSVYCIGNVVYRQNKTEVSASNALGKIGLQLSATPVTQPSVDIGGAQADEAVFGGFEDTGVVAAEPIAPAQPVQPQAYQQPVQPQQQMPSQAAALLNQYVQQGAQPNPAQGQGYGTGNYQQ